MAEEKPKRGRPAKQVAPTPTPSTEKKKPSSKKPPAVNTLNEMRAKVKQGGTLTKAEVGVALSMAKKVATEKPAKKKGPSNNELVTLMQNQISDKFR